MAVGTHAPEARPTAANDPMVGAVINGKFRITSIVANGGMGRIYRAEQLPLGRIVALKVLHTKYTSHDDDPQFQRRFFLEASILSKLQHPNIVTVFDYGRIESAEDESYFMAMEYLPGETLHRRLRALGALPPVEALAIIRQLARGLREAHRNDVVHRDLKPSNIMLVPEEDGNELVKILDFGLVKVLSDESEELTKEGSFLGSPRYMSPEQIAHGKVDHRTDIYSLGVIVYQCLCGRTPFENENSVHTLMAHLQLPIPPMRERNPSVDVPEVLENFARHCLEKDSSARPGSMEDFLRELRECEMALGLAPQSSPHTQSVTGGFATTARVSANPDSSDPHQITLSGRNSEPVHPIQAAPLISAPQPIAAPVVVAAPDSQRTTRGLIVALVAIIALLAVALAFRPQTTAPGVQPPTAPPTATEPASYRLIIESTVVGAQVYEGDALLGAAPLTVTVDNIAVRTTPRRMSVRKEGFASFDVTASPSHDASVRVIANLVALPVVQPIITNTPAPPSRPNNTRPVVRVVRPLPPTQPIQHPPPPDDIRSHR
jgi:eukaryotic-like serine/threonine-protein kinase